MFFIFIFFAGRTGPFILILTGFFCFSYALRSGSGSFVLACFVCLVILFFVSDVGECLLSLSVCFW